WSPDSKKIVFSSLKGYLYTLDIETLNSYLIGQGSSANWLEHGKNLTFYREQWNERFQLASSRLMKCRYNGINKNLLHESSNQIVRFVHYSPQHKKLSYISKNYLVIENAVNLNQKIQTKVERDVYFYRMISGDFQAIRRMI
ncbi:MAG: hypothetical protein JSW07_13870, partial [bacterium]